MKIKTAALREAFDFANRAVAKSTTLDILKHARFIAEGGKFTIACNNLHLFAEARGECAAGELSFCVKADRLGHALQSAGEEVELKLDKTLAWKSGRSRYTMATLPVDDFPVPKCDGKPNVTIEDESLVDHVTRVSFACAGKDPRQFTHGVGLEARGGELTVTATDGHRLATIAVNKGSYDDFIAIVPEDVVNALPDSPSEVRIFNERIEFTYPNGLIVASLVADKFPDWRRVMNMETEQVVKTSRPQLLSAIKAALPFDSASSVHLTMKDGQLLIVGVDMTESAEHAVPATGPEVDIWFLATTLTPVLQACKGDDVSLQFVKDPHGRRHLQIEEGAMRFVGGSYGR